MDDARNNAALAAAISAIGEPSFPDRLLALLRGLAGTDLCSAFAVGHDGSLRYLFAAGHHADIPDFAESASLAYASGYWQRDRTMRRALTGLGGGVHLIRQAWNGITDPDYRRACYERGGIVERLTLYAGGEPAIFASAYRSRASGHSSPAEVEALEKAAGIIMALVARHVAASHDTGQPAAHDIAHRLLASQHRLSQREASVAAALSLGRTQREIAEATGVALSSIVTYRRRAYRKLGVSDRHEIAGLLRRAGNRVETERNEGESI